MDEPELLPANQPKTNIYISADNQGINVSGLTNFEYLHLLHILRKFVQEPLPQTNSETVRDFANEIRTTAKSILHKSAIVYGPND